MAPPSKEDILVATQALRTQATVWNGQAGEMSALSTKVKAMDITRLEAGIFQLFIGNYNTLVDELTQRCSEGNAAMNEVAGTLRQVADTYDEEERKNVHKIGELW